MRHGLRWAAAVGTAVWLLGGCAGITEDMLAARENGIALLESGDYEGAIREFEGLIENTKRVSEFELDILKYRAEAEFGLGDYEAAAYTYDILNQVDGKKAEYYYFGALALAESRDADGAGKLLEEGMALDENREAPGFEEAMMALGETLTELGDKDGAEHIYEELLQSGHATTKLYNRLMVAEMEAGEYEKALSYSEAGQALSDQEAIRELKFNEAVCYEYLGEYGKALELFQGYIAEFGDDGKAEHEIAFLVTR